MAQKGQKTVYASQDVQELAVTYAALILHDGGVDVKATQIDKLVKFAGVNVESFWSKVYEKALQGKNIGELLAGGSEAPAQSTSAARATEAPKSGAVAAPKAVEKAPEVAEEDVDMGGLFD